MVSNKKVSGLLAAFTSGAEKLEEIAEGKITDKLIINELNNKYTTESTRRLITLFKPEINKAVSFGLQFVELATGKVGDKWKNYNDNEMRCAFYNIENDMNYHRKRIEIIKLRAINNGNVKVVMAENSEVIKYEISQLKKKITNEIKNLIAILCKNPLYNDFKGGE
jgi:hypothetical protein